MQLRNLVPREIIEIKDIEEIYKSQQVQLDKSEVDIHDLLNQFSVNTCTWGIVLWEKFIGILSDSSKSLEERKARVLAKIRGQGTTTIEAIKNICNVYADNTEVVEHTSEYWFELLLESYNGFLTDIES
ncbi:putative phage tail protein, partial [Clostridium sp.]|uniref:putative phage tail protein n=1 Tax=Clostridium sp. TaxID=1506 RepID=UPI00290761D9